MERQFDGKILNMEESVNQIQQIVDRLKTNPDDRRLIVSAWNVGEIDKMALPPCHRSFQFYSWEKKPGCRVLDVLMDIRSWDVFLGGPFNIASYAILLMMMAQAVNMEPGKLIINAGDAHLYENHIEYVLEQLGRGSANNPPKMILNPMRENIFDYTPEDFHLSRYSAHPNWKNVPIAV